MELLIIIDFYENLICQLPEFLDEIFQMGAQEMKELCIQKCKVPSTQFFEEKTINDKTFYIMGITTEDNVIVSCLVEPIVEKKEVWKLLQEFGEKADTSKDDNINISPENLEAIQQKIEKFNIEQKRKLAQRKKTKGKSSEFLDSDVEEIYDNRQKQQVMSKNLRYWLIFTLSILGLTLLICIVAFLFKQNLDSMESQLSL